MITIDQHKLLEAIKRLAMHPALADATPEQITEALWMELTDPESFIKKENETT